MEQLKKGVPRPCSVWGKFFSVKFKAELNQGPLMRFSSLLVRIGIVEINNKKEVVEWTRFWALSEKLAHSDQASWLSHVVMGVEEQHQEVSGLLGVCLSGTGALEGVRSSTSSSPRSW